MDDSAQPVRTTIRMGSTSVIMNDRMRRYMEEDWEDDEEERKPEQRDKKPVNPVAFDRQQRDKQWGKAHTSFWRAVKKQGGKNGKP